MVRVIPNEEFVWRGLHLCLGRRRRSVLCLVADSTHPHLYRIRYPDGWESTPGNITRAKDAAYGHARHLLAQETAAEAPHGPEAIMVLPTIPMDDDTAAA